MYSQRASGGWLDADTIVMVRRVTRRALADMDHDDVTASPMGRVTAYAAVEKTVMDLLRRGVTGEDCLHAQALGIVLGAETKDASDLSSERLRS